MPVAPKRAVGSSEASAYECFHSTFQAAVTHELEALVKDLRSAAGRVADQPVNLSDPRTRGDGGEDVSRSLKALVEELVARWRFVLATYRAHVAAEDEVVLPALAARVSNVAYELKHEAEDSLFDAITQALDEAVELIATNEGGGPAPADTKVGRERLKDTIQCAARTAHAIKTALAQHLTKEAAQLVPLMDGAFAADEQTALVERFIASVLANVVGPVPVRGPTEGEQGPLRTLIASWLGDWTRHHPEGSDAKNADDGDRLRGKNPNQPPARTSRAHQVVEGLVRRGPLGNIMRSMSVDSNPVSLLPLVNIRQCSVDGRTNSCFSNIKRQCCKGVVNRLENVDIGIDYRSVFNPKNGERITSRERVTQLFEPATGMEDYSKFQVHSAKCAWRPSQIHETLSMHPLAYHELYKTETSYDGSKFW